MEDRIDALFSDVEATVRAEEVHARRGELAEETAERAAEKTFVERLRGSLGHSIHLRVGEREITGTAVFLGAGIYVVSGFETSVVAIDSISELRLVSHRHRHDPGMLERLGMGSALRRLVAAHEEVNVVLKGGAGAIRGRSGMVAADYVEIAGRVIPFAAIAVVSARINPFAG